MGLVAWAQLLFNLKFSTFGTSGYVRLNPQFVGCTQKLKLGVMGTNLRPNILSDFYVSTHDTWVVIMGRYHELGSETQLSFLNSITPPMIHGLYLPIMGRSHELKLRDQLEFFYSHDSTHKSWVGLTIYG